MANVEREKVLRHYLERLHAGIVRTPLLNATPGPLGRGQKLDVADLERFAPNLPTQFVNAMIGGGSVGVHPVWPESEKIDPDLLKLREADQQKIYRQMDRYLIREAGRIERETGNRSLWLGYPLVWAGSTFEKDRAVLAPLFLFPLMARIDRSRQMSIELASDTQADGVVINRILGAWLETRCGISLGAISEDEAFPDDRLGVAALAGKILSAFDPLEQDDFSEPLGRTPDRDDRDPDQPARLLNAGVLGIMRWQNQAIMDDLELLIDRDDEQTTFDRLVVGADLPGREDIAFENEADRHHVAHADYSQEIAILQAREAPGVVVHGPPGTGKSQSITNIISDALGRGQWVLVVCQKRAALDVVANNLKKSGLDDLYLLIHDATSDREPTIDLIRDQIERVSKGRSHDAGKTEAERTRLAKEIEQIERKLDTQHHAFHEPRDCGISFARIMEQLIEVQQQHPDLVPDEKLARLVAMFSVEELRKFLESLAALAKRFVSCRPDVNPWRFHKPDFELTPANRRQVESLLASCGECDEVHQAFIAERGIGLAMDREPEIFLGDAERVASALDALIADEDFLRILQAYQATHADEGCQQRFNEIRDLSVLVSNHRNDSMVASLWIAGTPEERQRWMALIDRALEYEEDWLRLFRAPWRATKRVLQPMFESRGIPFDFKTMREVREVMVARTERLRLRRLLDQVQGLDLPAAHGDELIPSADAGQSDPELANDEETLDPKAIVAEEIRICLAASDRLSRWQKRWSDVEFLRTRFAAVSLALEFMAMNSPEDLKLWRKDLQTAIDRCASANAVEQAIDQLHPILEDPALDPLREAVRRGDPIQSDLDTLQESFTSIDALTQYDRRLSELTANESQILDHLVAAHLDHVEDAEKLAIAWQSVVELTTLDEWRRRAIRDTPDVAHMHDPRWAEQREKLASLLDEKREQEAHAIRENWQEKAREVAGGPWRKILRKRGVGAKRLREVVHLGHTAGLLTLRPCWLTNPDTASQLFPLEAGLFDIVIFDEASQLPVEQAMPSIYRASRLVVAGDEHQLPPTTFFQGSPAVSDPELWIDSTEPSAPPDSEEADDAEAGADRTPVDLVGLELALGCSDLLDLAKRLLPERSLDVHYRSQHPALIGFSNWAFYRGRLATAHPAWGAPSREIAPIRIHHVQGTYQNKTNPDEARHICDLLQYLWSMESDIPTVGVVTFNLPQEAAISEAIEQRAFTDHRFRHLLERELARKEGQRDAGFFVKNLESVQGDERDLILFSTTFGPTEPGNPKSFRRTFGPLTQAGGERRLNVAVTRARQGVILVSSMPFDRVSDVQAGVRSGSGIKARDYLQIYLNYASAVSTADQSGINFWLDQAARLDALDRQRTGSKPPEQSQSSFIDLVSHALTERGWVVDREVGEAGFELDLAVRHPDPKAGYLLGLICDGVIGERTWTARTREVWRDTILGMYGWDVRRLWSTQWWTQADQIINRLDAELTALVDQPDRRLPKRLNLPTLDELQPQVVDSSELQEQTPIARDAVKWAKHFAELNGTESPQEIAAWQNDGQSWQIAIETRQDGSRLRLRHESAIMDESPWHRIDTDRYTRLSTQLEQVSTHDDVLDWFHALQLAMMELRSEKN